MTNHLPPNAAAEIADFIVELMNATLMMEERFKAGDMARFDQWALRRSRYMIALADRYGIELPYLEDAQNRITRAGE
jgi:hypothetical protein